MRESARTFGELTRLIASASDSREVFDAVSRAAATLLGAKMARVWIDDSEARLLRAHGHFGPDPTAQQLMAESSAIPYGSGVVFGVFESRLPAYIPDVRKEPRWLNQRLATEGDLHAFAGIPLISGDRVVGVLAILFGKRRPFTLQEKELMNLLADHAAIAINNAWLHEEAERRRQAAEALAEVGRIVSQSLHSAEVGPRIVDSIRRLLGARASALFRLEPESGDLVLMVFSGEAVPLTGDKGLYPGGTGVVGVAVRDRRSVATPDLLSDPRVSLAPEVQSVAVESPDRATLAVPLLVHDKVIGALSVRDQTGRVFNDEEVRLAEAFANQAAIAMQNARLFEEAERRRKAAEALAEVGRLLAQSLDVREVGQRIVDSVRRLFGVDYSILSRLEEGSGDLVIVASSGESSVPLPPGLVFPRGTAAIGLAVREGRSVASPDVLSDPRITLKPEIRGRIEQAGYGAVLAVPLLVQDRAIGALGLGDRKGRVFTDEEARLAQAFADRAAWALESARLYKEVRDARDFLQSITESSIDAIFTADVHGRMTYFSPGATEIFGYQPEEGLGRPVADFYRGGLEEARTVMERVRVAGRIRNYETAFRAKDGRWVEVNASFSLLRDPSGGIVGTVGVVKDITEQKRLEENLRQSQKMEAVGRLAGGIAHDFNNLMTIITGRAEMLLGRLRPDDPLHRDIELFRKTSARAAAVTRQLLAFSRKQVLQPKVLDLNAVVAGMDSMLRRLIGEDIDLVTALEPALWHVRADPGQLEQVILNLVVNARDAMPNGGKLTVETGNVELDEGYASRHVAVKPGSFVLLAVSDTGMGMDQATRSRMFEPFFTTKEQGEGTGLGLATVYGIVKQSGGSIWCYSEPGQGTAFKIYLPRVDEAVESLEPAPPAAAPQRGSETVLLVEDEDELRSVAREMLEMYGYTVLEADHPDEALLKAERHSGPIHVLVTDVVMPKMSGRDLARRLVPLRPEMRVLYISGYTDEAIVHHGVLDSGTAFLEKPFNPDELARKVREVLDRA
ncbi:MAG: GAF domain-containing protein [Candidatus Rokuibacteriota bacterium]